MKNKERIVEYTIVHNGEKEIMDLPLLLHSNRKNKSDDDTQLMIEQDDLKFVRSKGLNNYIIGDFEVTYLIFPTDNIDSIPPFKLKVSVDDLEKYSSNISQHHSSVNYETGEVIYSDFNLSNLPLNKMSLWLNTPFRKKEVIKIKIKYIRMETKENKPEEVVGQDQPTQDFQSEQGVNIPEISDEAPVYGGEASTTEELSDAMEKITEAFESESVTECSVDEFKTKPEPTRDYSIMTTEQAVNTTSDAVVFGDGDMWKLLCKFSSQSNRVMKSTKALEIKMVGCLVQVTTVENGLPSEAITFVPNTVIVEDKDEKGNVINRRLEASPYAVR
jgi:hypothetical protein